MNQGPRTTSTGAMRTASPERSRRGELLELAHRLEDFGRRIEGFIDDQLQRLEQAGASLEQAITAFENQPSGGGEASSEELQRKRDAWEREKRDEIRKIEEDRRLLADAWIRLEGEQRQLLSQRASATRGPAETIDAPVEQQENTEPEVHHAQPANQTKKLGKARNRRIQENGSRPMNEADRQAMKRQFQQLRSDVRNHAQRRQQC